MREPSLTLAICTYNNADILDRALAALQEQRVSAGVPWSVLVVNNNSTDHTAEVVERYASAGRLPGLRMVRETCQGLAAARRRAVIESDSEWVAFVDDDCLLGPEWVQRALSFCRRHPRAGAVGGRIRLLWEVPPDEVLLRWETTYASQEYGDAPRQITHRGLDHLVGAGLVLRREALVASGWLERMLLTDRKGGSSASGGDSEIIWRIYRAGYELWYTPEMELRHFVPRRRMSLEYVCRLNRAFGECWAVVRLLRRGQAPTLPRRAWLMALGGVIAAKALGATARGLATRRCLTADARVRLHSARGVIEGSTRFLLRGFGASHQP